MMMSNIAGDCTDWRRIVSAALLFFCHYDMCFLYRRACTVPRHLTMGEPPPSKAIGERTSYENRAPTQADPRRTSSSTSFSVVKESRLPWPVSLISIRGARRPCDELSPCHPRVTEDELSFSPLYCPNKDDNDVLRLVCSRATRGRSRGRQAAMRYMPGST